MRNLKKLGLVTFVMAVPYVALGAFEETATWLGELIGIINTLIPAIFALILLAFFWGLAKYVFNAGNESARQQGKQVMIAGIIALFIASAIWGIINFLTSDLLPGNFNSNTPPDLPRAPSGS